MAACPTARGPNLAAPARQKRLSKAALTRVFEGDVDEKTGIREAPQRSFAALAALVRQSGKPRHDRALSGALSQLGPDPRRTDRRQADHRHCPDRQRSFALQPPPHRTGRARPRRHSRRRRHRLRIPGASDPGNRKTPRRRARPKPCLSRPGRTAVRLSARRRRADDRLRQDHAGLHHGGGDGEHPGHRFVRRTDAQWLARRQARRLRHGGVGSARGTRRRQDHLQGIHRSRRRLGAVDRPLQHDGHRLDHERARRSARHVATGLLRHSGAVSRARADRLRDRRARRADRAGRSQAVRHSHPQGVREHHRRQFGDRRLDQCADPHQRHRAPHRRQARHQ